MKRLLIYSFRSFPPPVRPPAQRFLALPRVDQSKESEERSENDLAVDEIKLRTNRETVIISRERAFRTLIR